MKTPSLGIQHGRRATGIAMEILVTGDFVYALQLGSYESGVQAKPAVEPTTSSSSGSVGSLVDIALAADDLFDSDDLLWKKILRSR